jgi:hypothetical protein
MGICFDAMVDIPQPSDDEFAVLLDKNFLIQKNSISKSIQRMLAFIEGEIKEEIKKCSFPFPDDTFLKSGKISKGENYRGLPYFVLDYPRLFKDTDIFTFRTMLRWGHEFSCTLHLSGNSLKYIDDEVFSKLKQLEDSYFCISSSPWEYHYESDNYILVSKLTVEVMKNHIEQHHFVKISRCISLNSWDFFPTFCLENLQKFLNLLAK